MLQPVVWGPWGPRSSGVYLLDLAFLAPCVPGALTEALMLSRAWWWSGLGGKVWWKSSSSWRTCDAQNPLLLSAVATY